MVETINTDKDCPNKDSYSAAITIPVTEDERQIFEWYSNKYGISIITDFKEALFEKKEDDYDVMIAEQCLEEMKRNYEVRKPLEDLKKELGLD